MNMEQKTFELPMDDDYQNKLLELQKEGWGIVPNTKPMVTMELCRKVPDVEMTMQLGIDDDKVFILRPDGQLSKV